MFYLEIQIRCWAKLWPFRMLTCLACAFALCWFFTDLELDQPILNPVAEWCVWACVCWWLRFQDTEEEMRVQQGTLRQPLPERKGDGKVKPWRPACGAPVVLGSWPTLGHLYCLLTVCCYFIICLFYYHALSRPWKQKLLSAEHEFPNASCRENGISLRKQLRWAIVLFSGGN